MRILKTKKELENYVQASKQQGNKLAFVPTMGALHAGHIALVQEADRIADTSLVSIFVNPTQFNNQQDLKHYPRTLEADIQKLQEKTQCQAVFCPNEKEMYPDGTPLLDLDLNGMDQILEGASRPGHFQGVVTVVDLLFHAVQPDFALFGEKDWQQLAIIKYMVKKLRHPIQIVPVPTVRESSGLAMSSRNERLSGEDRAYAAKLSVVIFGLKELIEKEGIAGAKIFASIAFKELAKFDLDYCKIIDSNTLQEVHDLGKHTEISICVAATISGVRLIDNVRMNRKDYL